MSNADTPDNRISTYTFPSPKEESPETEESLLYVIALVKESRRYVFTFDRDSRGAFLQKLADLADDPDEPFTWHSAKVCVEEYRKLCR